MHEILTNKWYHLAEDTNVIVEWNETTNSTIENELRKAQVKVIKIDKDNNEIKLEGVKFEVLDENQKVLETIVTDKNGEALTSKYPIRDFQKLYIRESESLENYVLNDEIIEITLEENKIKTIEFQNEKKKGYIKILKVSNGDNLVLNIPDGTPLAGAKFTIVDADGNTIGIYETDENGTVQIDNIPYGEYTIYESEVPEGYLMDAEPQTIFIAEDGEIIETIFKDSPIEPELHKTGIDININAAIIFVVLFSIASIIALIKKYIKMEE